MGPDAYDCGKYVVQHDLFPYNKGSRFLVAVNKHSDELLFLSGDLFLSDYYAYFKNTKASEETRIRSYLEMRFYCIDHFKGLELVKRSKRFLYYLVMPDDKGYYTFKIRVEKNDPAHIRIRFLQ